MQKRINVLQAIYHPTSYQRIQRLMSNSKKTRLNKKIRCIQNTDSRWVITWWIDENNDCSIYLLWSPILPWQPEVCLGVERPMREQLLLDRADSIKRVKIAYIPSKKLVTNNLANSITVFCTTTDCLLMKSILNNLSNVYLRQRYRLNSQGYKRVIRL